MAAIPHFSIILSYTIIEFLRFFHPILRVLQMGRRPAIFSVYWRITCRLQILDPFYFWYNILNISTIETKRQNSFHILWGKRTFCWLLSQFCSWHRLLSVIKKQTYKTTMFSHAFPSMRRAGYPRRDWVWNCAWPLWTLGNKHGVLTTKVAMKCGNNIILNCFYIPPRLCLLLYIFGRGNCTWNTMPCVLFVMRKITLTSKIPTFRGQKSGRLYEFSCFSLVLKGDL